MTSNRLARQLLGTLRIHKNCIRFELCLWKKKKEEESKKEDEQKSKFSSLVVSNLLKVSGTSRVDTSLEY